MALSCPILTMESIYDCMEIALDNPFAPQSLPTSPPSTPAFYDLVESTRNELNTLQSHLNTLSEFFEQILINNVLLKRDNCTVEIGEDDIQKQTSIISDDLEVIRDKMKRLNEVISDDLTNDDRLRKNLLSTLQEEFTEMENRMKTIKEEYEDELKRVQNFVPDGLEVMKVNEARNIIVEKAKYIPTRLSQNYNLVGSTYPKRKGNSQKMSKNRSLQNAGWLFVDSIPQLMEGQNKAIHRLGRVR